MTSADPAGAHDRWLVLRGPWTPPGELLRAVAAHRHLALALGRKNFHVQYRRAALGLAWAVGLPLAQAVVLAVVFSRIGRFDVPHYPVFVFSGLVAFSAVQGSVLSGTTAIVDNASLSSKVYFPRAVLPLAQSVTAAYALGAGVLVLLAAALVSGAPLGARTLLLVPGAVLAVALGTSMSLVLSVAHVYLRDTKYVVQAVAFGWLWLTPVVYPLTAVDGALRTVLLLNPATGVVQLFHAAFATDVGTLAGAWVTVGWVVVLSGLAVLLHARYDRVLADLL